MATAMRRSTDDAREDPFAEVTFAVAEAIAMWSIEPARLAVVDDEPEVRGMLADYFGKDGYLVSPCASGAEFDVVMASQPADLVILDIAMPGEDGISIARRLRAAGNTPIIMLTGLNDVVERIIGLEVGADDYVTKPFDLRELRARVRAVLRRFAPPAPDIVVPEPGQEQIVSFGRVLLDLGAHCLIDRDGFREMLTATEFELLVTFARNPNRVLSRDRLLDGAAHRDRDALDRAVDIRVARIRKKIEHDPAKPEVIKTVWNAGYIYVPPPTRPAKSRRV
jgi:two-component system phosphate regulon response regulator OmpR